MDPMTLMLVMFMMGSRKEKEGELGFLPLLMLMGCCQNPYNMGAPCSCSAPPPPPPTTQVPSCVPQGCNPLLLGMVLSGGAGFGGFFRQHADRKA
jgi:hypothetical protein